MELVGVSVGRELVLELADLLVHSGARDTAAALLRASAADEDAYLTLEDKDAIVLALEGRPEPLEPLRLAILEDLGQVDDAR